MSDEEKNCKSGLLKFLVKLKLEALCDNALYKLTFTLDIDNIVSMQQEKDRNMNYILGTFHSRSLQCVKRNWLLYTERSTKSDEDSRQLQ